MSAVGEAIAAEALSWVGTPFLWQGRVKGRGCDCKGLVAGVAAVCERPEAASVEALAGDYNRIVDAQRLRAGLARLFDRAAADHLAPGDVLLLRVAHKPQHLGIVVSTSTMVHCYGAGPFPRVMETVIPRAKLDSVWRWRDLP